MISEKNEIAVNKNAKRGIFQLPYWMKKEIVEQIMSKISREVNVYQGNH